MIFLNITIPIFIQLESILKKANKKVEFKNNFHQKLSHADNQNQEKYEKLSHGNG